MTARPITADILRAALQAYHRELGLTISACMGVIVTGSDDDYDDVLVDGWISYPRLAELITAEMDKVTE